MINPNVIQAMQVVTKVHTTYCEKCPSNKAVYPESDPESKEISNYPDGVKQQYVFPCAWRNKKLCKGICEEYNYTEEEHKHLLAADRRI